MRLTLIIVFLALVQICVGQGVPQKEQTVTTKETKVGVSDGVVATKESPFGFFKMFSGNPGKAALYSAIMPSAGQLYNKNYWKVPLVLAIEGTAIYLIIDNTSNFKAWRQGHIDLDAGRITSFRNATTASQARLARDQWRQWRDFAIIGTAAIHLIQIADAFIHRHLVEFDISDDLSLNAYTTGQSIGVVLTF
jgi:hypothetical protein